MKPLISAFLFLNLTHCFLVPRLRVKQALLQENCEKLGGFLHNLTLKDLKKGFEICLKKKNFKQALLFLNEQKEKTDFFVFLEKRAGLYSHLDEIDLSIQDYKTLLKNQPQNKKFYQNLLDLYIKKSDFKKGLEVVSSLLNLKLSRQESLEFEFVQARLFLLLYKKTKARDVFLSVQEKDPEFFKKKKGFIYLALLSEEEQNFDKAIQELQEAQWQGAESKIQHWQMRELNKPL